MVSRESNRREDLTFFVCVCVEVCVGVCVRTFIEQPLIRLIYHVCPLIIIPRVSVRRSACCLPVLLDT